MSSVVKILIPWAEYLALRTKHDERSTRAKNDATLPHQMWDLNVELRTFSPVAGFLQRMQRHSLLHMSRRPGLLQTVELTDLGCTLMPIGALPGICIYAEFSLAIDMNQGLHCQTVPMIG